MRKIPIFSVNPSPHKTSGAALAKILAEGKFGDYPTDHIAVIHWNEERGWHNAEICGRRPFALDPAAGVLHYAQEIFEGMKAYKNERGEVFLFRPQQNARRFNRSAQRMCMPPLPEELFLQAVEGVARLDHQWISPQPGHSLYIRPFMFASEAFLGVRPAREFTFCVTASPAANYFEAGAKIALWVEESLSRAAPGGTGEAKCGGNYAAGMEAQAIAARNGCAQTVFLDAIEHNYVEELGGMNIFFVFKDGVIKTPALDGTILRGITRASLLELARDKGFKTEECRYSFAQWQQDAKSGAMIEAFACGTAAIIAPIGKIRHKNGEFTIGAAQSAADSVTEQLKAALLGIQSGRAEDKYGWRYPVAIG